MAFYRNPDGSFPTENGYPVFITEEQYRACCCGSSSSSSSSSSSGGYYTGDCTAFRAAAEQCGTSSYSNFTLDSPHLIGAESHPCWDFDGKYSVTQYGLDERTYNFAGSSCMYNKWPTTLSYYQGIGVVFMKTDPYGLGTPPLYRSPIWALGSVGFWAPSALNYHFTAYYRKLLPADFDFCNFSITIPFWKLPWPEQLEEDLPWFCEVRGRETGYPSYVTLESTSA